MWNFDEKDLVKTFEAKRYLDESKAIVCEIKQVKFATTPNGSKQVVLEVEPEGYNPIGLWIVYESARVGQLDWVVSKLNQLCAIIGVKPQELETKAVGKKVGMFLKAKLSQNKRYINFDLDGVFYPETKKTTKEEKEGLEPETYVYFEKRYALEPKLERIREDENSISETVFNNTTETTETDDDDDDFPF